jgi:hypothetical protein
MSRRSNTKFPGLDGKKALKIRQELIDQDYIDKLSEKEKAWLNSFIEEEVNGRVYKTKGYKPKLNKTAEERKRVNDMNNHRNADIYSRAKARGELDEFKNFHKDVASTNPHDVEDALIEKIDFENEINAEVEKLSEIIRKQK